MKMLYAVRANHRIDVAALASHIASALPAHFQKSPFKPVIIVPTSQAAAANDDASTAAYAQAYVNVGLQPVALVPNEKRPAFTGWQSTAASTVIQVLEANADYNLGIALSAEYIVLDIDVKNGVNGFETLQRWEEQHGPMPHTLCQRTPSGGRHIVLKLPLGMSLKNKVNFAPGVDIRADGGFIVGEPSIISGRTYAWIDWDVLTEPMPNIAIVPDWFLDLYQMAETKTTERHPIVNQGEQIILAGQRNGALYRKACAMRGQGFNAVEIDAALQQYNARACKPPLLPKEVTQTATSAAKYEPNPPPFRQPHVPSFNLKALVATSLFIGPPPPVKWLVEQVFQLGKVSVLASPPGVGKSNLALALAVDVATAPTGTLWNGARFSFGGRVQAQGNVVVISAEDDLEELHRRLYALVGESAMPEKLHVVSLPDQGHFCFVQGDSRKNMSPTEAWLALKAEILRLGNVQLVVVDTLQAVSAGDLNAAENAQAMMNELVELATRSGASVLLIHHIVKRAAAEQKGMLAAQDAMDAVRGSGAIVGSARAAYVLYPHPAGEEICEVMDCKYEQNKVVYGLVAKANGAARRDYTIYIRDEHGVLRDRTLEYRRRSQDGASLLDGELVEEIVRAYRAGVPFAAAAVSANGLHKRRFELPKQFHDLPAKWFVQHAEALVHDEKVRKEKITNGYQYAPVDALSAMADEDGQDFVECKDESAPLATVKKPIKRKAATKKVLRKKLMLKKNRNKNDV